MRYRHWLLTKNYKSNKVLTNDEIISLINQSNDVTYYVFQLEKGSKENTKHHHLFISYKNAKYTNTMINKFPGFHIKEVTNTPEKVVEYCKKEDSRLSEPVEFGSLPQQGKRKDLEKIYDMIKDDYTDAEIREIYPSQYMRFYRNIEHIRQQLKYEKFKKIFRKLEVTYIYGSPGSGKSKSVIDKHGYENIYRVTDKRHPFDMYEGQDVVVFEEFRSSFTFDEILNYLDGYPLILPARYNQKVACYTKVYIITNIVLDKQYMKKQENDPESFQAFCRRIHKIQHYSFEDATKSKVIIKEYQGVNNYLKELKLKDYIERYSNELERIKFNSGKFNKPLIYVDWFDNEDDLKYYDEQLNKKFGFSIPQGKELTLEDLLGQ